MKKTPQQQAADLRRSIEQDQHNADNSPVASGERRFWEFQIKLAKKELQRLKSKYRHIPYL